MQPLAYFAVRSLLGWLQYVERTDRAFMSSALLLVATGAAHCWAVVYALFIAIHTRAMRYDGYHEGYVEHLPFWVSWTETLAVASMGIWWAAGFTTAAIRIIDDDAKGLPMEGRDVAGNFLVNLMRSEKLHNGLDMAHTLSCVGLFVSIILLCIAMALMKGTVTACELCLCFVSIGFALPHAVVAGRRLNINPKKTDVLVAPAPAAEAAAQEAAALGPQLCVILALADSPGHAFLWQNMAYVVAAVSFVAAVAACGRSPPKVGDAALPPDAGEFFACLALDAVASASLVVCFPHLNTWHLWALFALLVLLFVAVWFEGWRDIMVDLLDPLMVVRSDTDKVLPGKQRQQLRKACWATATVCAAVALWDILMHPVPEGHFEIPDIDDLDMGLPDLWDQNSMLLLRWKEAPEVPGEQELLAGAAQALDLEADKLATQSYLPDHRLLVFKVAVKEEYGGKQRAHERWRSALPHLEGKFGRMVDVTFPSVLNVSLCIGAHHDWRAEDGHHDAESEEAAAGKDEKSTDGGAADASAKDPKKKEMTADFNKTVGTAPAAQEAYLAGCGWWSKTLDAYYVPHEDDEHHDLHDYAHHDDDDHHDEHEDEEGSDIAE